MISFFQSKKSNYCSGGRFLLWNRYFLATLFVSVLLIHFVLIVEGRERKFASLSSENEKAATELKALSVERAKTPMAPTSAYQKKGKSTKGAPVTLKKTFSAKRKKSPTGLTSKRSKGRGSKGVSARVTPITFQKTKGAKSKETRPSPPQGGTSKKSLCQGRDTTIPYEVSYRSSDCPNKKKMEKIFLLFKKLILLPVWILNLK